MNSSIIPVPLQSDNPFHTFDFGDTPVRVITINDEAWFVSADVCKVMDIGNSSQAVARLDDDEKGVISADTPGGVQSISVISEAGLYSLVLTSRKDNAKRFRRWISHDVIPTIRKTGSYTNKPMSTAQILVAQAQAFLEHENRLTAIEAQLQARNEYFTVLAYCRLRDIPTPTLATAGQVGKRCVALSHERGLEIGRVNDPRWGWVNTYHENVLSEVLNGE